MRVVIVAGGTLLLLTGCIGVNPYTAGGPGLGAQAALAPAAAPEIGVEQDLSQPPLEDAPRPVGRRNAGVDPMTVLNRPAPRAPRPPAAAEILPAAAPPRASAPALREPARAPAIPNGMAAPSGMPVLDAPSPKASAEERPASARSPAQVVSDLSKVDALAQAAQRAQDINNRRFDANVRRATASVCSNCLTGSASRAARTRTPQPDVEVEAE